MFAVVLIPDFSLQAVLRHKPGLISQAVALTDPELPKLGIIQCTVAARNAGVEEGISASQAIGRCGDLVIKSRSSAQEQSATAVLIQTAYCFSPFIELTALGVCTMDLRGLRIVESESAMSKWVEEISKALAQFNLDSRIGFAVTPELALLGARHQQSKSGHSFPLTPTLSLRERENGSAGSLQSEALEFAERRAKSPPLPEGEGRGEGEGDVLSPELCLHDKPVPPREFEQSAEWNSAIRQIGNLRYVIVSNPAEFVSRLPTQMLGLPAEMLEILNHWGIHTAGALKALGKDALAERLGPVMIEVFERLSPDSIRPLKITAFPEVFAEQMEFQHEVETLEPLLFALRRFVEQLSRRIDLLYLVVAELHLKLGLSSGAAYETLFKVPSPTGDAEILFRMLHTHLENVRTDTPIISLCLTAKPALPQAHQFGLFEITLRNPNRFAETLARLEALCGPNRVGTPVLEPTLRPDSFRMNPVDFCGMDRKKAQKTNDRSRVRVEDRSRAACTRRGLQLRRFRPPLAAQVEFRERCPVLIRSGICNGRIVDRRGPFLISGNWWDEGRWWREEWDVQVADGAMYRIFTDGPSRTGQGAAAEECFLEGVYD
jgi:protein ImuB